MRVAFVGMRRSPSDMPAEYWPTFVRFHLELPYYYARYATCDVDLVTVEPVDYREQWPETGTIRCITEDEYRVAKGHYDLIVHWRKWFTDLSDPLTRNVILSQDHSYGPEWKSAVREAGDGLDGILVFPTWHKENTANELVDITPRIRLYEGMTLGVDTDVYRPVDKDPFHLLWASDPGRGLETLINPFLRLWSADRRFRLTVTYPDYVRPESVARFDNFLKHPGVRHMPGLRNGQALWDLFNSAGFIPYSSTFMEPSSRCHRQGMAAGSMVLYPPGMGTPSYLIENGLTGIIESVDMWPDIIRSAIKSGRRDEIGQNARTFAVSENWAVQARRFHSFFSSGSK